MRIALALARHELRLLISLLLWVTRRRDGVGDGRAFGYARGQGAVMAGFAFVCVVETFTMSVLLRGWPAVHRVVLVLDLYTVLFVVGLHAASVARPHVLTHDALRIRYAGHVDLRIPIGHITAVRRELRASEKRAEGALDVTVGGQTSVTVELAESVSHLGLFGRRRAVSVVRFHADDADTVVAAIRQARNVPSPLPGRRG